MTDLDAIRKHHEQVTGYAPAPWRWCGQDSKSRPSVYLATVNHGRKYVMGARRVGFAGAVPAFPVQGADGYGTLTAANEGLIVRERDYREDIDDIDNPFAEYLKRAPEYVGALLAEVDALRHECARYRAAASESTAGVQ